MAIFLKPFQTEIKKTLGLFHLRYRGMEKMCRGVRKKWKYVGGGPQNMWAGGLRKIKIFRGVDELFHSALLTISSLMIALSKRRKIFLKFDKCVCVCSLNSSALYGQLVFDGQNMYSRTLHLLEQTRHSNYSKMFVSVKVGAPYLQKAKRHLSDLGYCYHINPFFSYWDIAWKKWKRMEKSPKRKCWSCHYCMRLHNWLPFLF